MTHKTRKNGVGAVGEVLRRRMWRPSWSWSMMYLQKSAHMDGFSQIEHTCVTSIQEKQSPVPLGSTVFSSWKLFTHQHCQSLVCMVQSDSRRNFWFSQAASFSTIQCLILLAAHCMFL